MSPLLAAGVNGPVGRAALLVGIVAATPWPRRWAPSP
jgi:hypothetical protein